MFAVIFARLCRTTQLTACDPATPVVIERPSPLRRRLPVRPTEGDARVPAGSTPTRLAARARKGRSAPRLHAALAALSIGALAIALPGHAEGVIVKSTNPEHPVGAILAVGEALRLQPGEAITVLDRSGVLVMASGAAYAGPAQTRPASLAATGAAVLAGPRANPAVGGVRNSCDAGAGGPPPSALCNQVRGTHRKMRVFSVAGEGRKVPALGFESNFDGYALCVHWSGSSAAQFLPGADPTSPLRLAADTITTWDVQRGERAPWSKRGAKVAVTVSCEGVSPEVWESIRTMAPDVLTADSAEIVLASWSRLKGEKAETSRLRIGSAR
jgi:hypothetical protein